MAYSRKGKEYKAEMEEFHSMASKLLFQEKNKNRLHTEVDLHGQYVKEAVAYAEASLKKCVQRGDSEIRFIVGKGLHSSSGKTRIKPALQDLMRQRGFHCRDDPRNSGVLVVRLYGDFGADVLQDRVVWQDFDD